MKKLTIRLSKTFYKTICKEAQIHKVSVSEQIRRDLASYRSLHKEYSSPTKSAGNGTLSLTEFPTLTRYDGSVVTLTFDILSRMKDVGFSGNPNFSKILAIKALRDLTYSNLGGMVGLLEAKNFVESIQFMRYAYSR